MANALGTLFGEIADAIREKTRETGTMKPAQFPEKIAGIEAGGGSSADVRYVIFMNGDAELYKKPVAVGDDCVDVLTKGWIATPTKESTVSTNYTYSGWALSDEGDAVASALLAVTEDRTVYAAYTESVRKYTVNFYDGETLLESQQVGYGSTPAYVTEKEGYSFTGWEPAITSVTGDADYYAQWEETVTFAGGSWADIARISEAGEAEQYFAVGDSRTIVTSDGVTIKLKIAGFNHDTLSDSGEKAGMTIFTYTANSAYCLISSDHSGDKYLKESAKFGQQLGQSLFNTFPDELKSIVKNVDKVCTKFTNYTAGTETHSHNWFLPARSEVDPYWGTIASHSVYGPVYKLFENNTFGNTYNTTDVNAENIYDENGVLHKNYFLRWMDNNGYETYAVVKKSKQNNYSQCSGGSGSYLIATMIAFCI